MDGDGVEDSGCNDEVGDVLLSSLSSEVPFALGEGVALRILGALQKKENSEVCCCLLERTSGLLLLLLLEGFRILEVGGEHTEFSGEERLRFLPLDAEDSGAMLILMDVKMRVVDFVSVGSVAAANGMEGCLFVVIVVVGLPVLCLPLLSKWLELVLA